jgi:hypothetical protein
MDSETVLSIIVVKVKILTKLGKKSEKKSKKWETEFETLHNNIFSLAKHNSKIV